MADDLAARIRRTALENLAGNLEMTCERARAHDYTPHACGHAHGGHRCWWTNPPHARHQHKCVCGTYWGEGSRV